MPLRGFPADAVSAHEVAGKEGFPLHWNGLWSILEHNPTGPEHQQAPAVPKPGRTEEDGSFLLFLRQIHQGGTAADPPLKGAQHPANTAALRTTGMAGSSGWTNWGSWTRAQPPAGCCWESHPSVCRRHMSHQLCGQPSRARPEHVP